MEIRPSIFFEMHTQITMRPKENTYTYLYIYLHTYVNKIHKYIYIYMHMIYVYTKVAEGPVVPMSAQRARYRRAMKQVTVSIWTTETMIL